MECRICRIQYIGKSETKVYIRLNNHRKDEIRFDNHRNRRTLTFQRNFVLFTSLKAL